MKEYPVRAREPPSETQPAAVQFPELVPTGVLTGAEGAEVATTEGMEVGTRICVFDVIADGEDDGELNTTEEETTADDDTGTLTADDVAILTTDDVAGVDDGVTGATEETGPPARNTVSLSGPPQFS